MRGDPIYYMAAEAAFKKGKTIYTRKVWIVSTYVNPSDIMKNDQKTMSRLAQEFYGKSKAERKIIIRKINSKKQIGTVSWDKK